MTVTAPAQMCRLVVCGPDRQLEIAVPAQVVVADLLPALLHHLGDGLADAGLAHGGWVLQRLGGPPLDEDSTVGVLGLTDGAVVHLRPRAEQIPPVHFDDLADGLAAGVRNRPAAWRPEMTRWAAIGVAAVVPAAGLVAFATTGPALLRALVAAVLAVLLLAGALVFSRAFGDRAFGVVAAAAGVAYGALAAMIAPDVPAGVTRLVFGGPQLFAATVVAAALAGVAGALAGTAGPAFAGLTAAALCGAAGAGPAAFLDLGAGSAAVVAVLATVLTAVVPVTAFRLARIRLAPLPTAPEHLQEDIDPEPSEELLRRASAADRYMTGLHAGLGAAATAGLVLLALHGGWAAGTLVALAAVARLLSARPMTSGWHRAALAVPALAGLVAVALVMLRDAGPAVRAAVVPVGVLALLLGLFALARRLPGRRVMPVWGRLGDVAQLVATVAMLPLLAAVLDLYGAARALGG